MYEEKREKQRHLRKMSLHTNNQTIGKDLKSWLHPAHHKCEELL